MHSSLSAALLHPYHPCDCDGASPEDRVLRYADLATFPVHMPLSEASKVRSLVPDLCSVAMVQMVCGMPLAQAHAHFTPPFDP